jgi:hypothetical protein
MFEIPCFKGLKKVLWKDIEIGQIVIKGGSVNGTTPYELSQFPVLTASLLTELNQKYHFQKNKEFIIAESLPRTNPQKTANFIKELPKKIKSINLLRENYQKAKLQYFIDNKLVYDNNTIFTNPNFSDKKYLKIDQFNSFEVKIKRATVPSLFHNLNDKIEIKDILSGLIQKRLNFPGEYPIHINIGIDFSNQMFDSNKLKSVIQSLNEFYEKHIEIFSFIQFNIYGFSNQTVLLKYPFSIRDMEKNQNDLSSLLKKIISSKSKTNPNFLIVFTSSLPENFMDTIENASKFKRSKIDSMVVFMDYDLKKETKETLFEKQIAITETLGSNVVSLTKENLFPYLLLEIIDNYLGNLSLSHKKIDEVEFVEFEKPTKNSNQEIIKGKTVKPFSFRKIK